MITFLDPIFKIDQYRDDTQRDQARLVCGFTLIMIVLPFALAIFKPLHTDASALVPIIGVFGVGIVTLALLWTGHLELASFGPVIMWYSGAVFPAAQAYFQSSDAGAALIVLVFLSGLYLHRNGLIGGTVLALVTLVLSAMSSAGKGIQTQIYVASSAELGLLVVCASLFTYFFLRITALGQSSGSLYDERLKLANVTTQIAKRISRRATVADLLSSAVNDIRDSYSTIYHVQIFLLNPQGTEAELTASTGDVGKMLLDRKHSLPVGSQSVIGQVTRTGQNVIARAGSAEGIHRRNEFLPDTVAEAAFPLKIGEAVIGALDLQSRSISAFTESELPIFQSLADSIAVAIDNARLFGQTEQRIQENQRVVEQMRSAVREVERLNRQLTEQAWTEFLNNKDKQLGVDVDFSNNVVRSTVSSTPTLDEAAQTNQLIQKQTRDGVIVSVPLRVRGAVIGAMEFELPGEVLTPEDVNLVQAVAERFGLAVESTRLYEESRRVAQRETMLNEIGGRLQRTNSIDSVLAEAARGLQSSLGANRVAIRLGAPPKAEGGAA